MRKVIFLVITGLGWAQTPTGIISGVVGDPAGAAIPGAHVKVASASTGLVRELKSGEQGDYSTAALPVGTYEVTAEAPGFRKLSTTAVVEAGTATTVDLHMVVGQATDTVTVSAASPQMQYDSHTVGGLIRREQIADLPLNGRSFLELAKLEPGVQPPSRASSNRLFVPVLGSPGGNSGRGTLVTIDGGSIMAVGNGGSAMGFSQEGVREFQTSTVNFDLSTGLTMAGAINVITRSGNNDLNGTAFYFFRDHHLAAYPGLNRNPADPDPFFQRRQFGGALGGPIRRDRVFFFADWERNEQRGVADTTLTGDFAQLSRITPTPLFGDQLSVRLDGRLSSKHRAFARYSHDGNRAFGPPTNQNSVYPSDWIRQFAWADQSILGLTSILRPALVNDLRFSYFFVSSSEVAAQEQDCPGCLGIGSPLINVPQAGLTIGHSMTILNLSRRFQLTDAATWQLGRHRASLGVDWEYNRGGPLTDANDPVAITLFSPNQVSQYNARSQTPPDLRIPLPAAFTTGGIPTVADILGLPLQGFTLGIGDPRVPQENGGMTRAWNTARLFFEDTWRLQRRLTLNYGLAWNIDRNQNYDLAKPALLAPILGADGLRPTRKQWKNFSPSLGLAWSPSRDGKTVIRAGAGIFYDFLFPPNLDSERSLLGPRGLGQQTISSSPIVNPSLLSGADLMSTLTAIRASQAQSLTYSGDPSVQSIQILKQASGPSGVYPVNVPTWSALHVNLGVQREIARDFVLNADLVYRHFIHGGLGGPSGIDLNHYNSVGGAVLPKCTPAQQTDPAALCSTGPINVYEATSNQTYKGLLLRAEKRFSGRYQILASYAYSSNTGTAGTSSTVGLNLDNWLQNSGPLSTDFIHIVNLAGVVQLPAAFELGLNFSYSSAPPFSATVGTGSTGIDFNGDGTTGDLLPGTTVNAFNRGLGRSDLARLVSQFNQTYAGTNDPHGRAIPALTLPASYSFGDSFQSLDLRLSRPLVSRERWSAILIGEVFNLYNAANLTFPAISSDLTNTASFGQPTGRSTQVFGSGGPRAFQLAIRMNFSSPSGFGRAVQ